MYFGKNNFIIIFVWSGCKIFEYGWFNCGFVLLLVIIIRILGLLIWLFFCLENSFILVSVRVRFVLVFLFK